MTSITTPQLTADAVLLSETSGQCRTVDTQPRSSVRRLAERGMVTAEYAVGILAAVALALVLLKVFRDNSVFTALLHYVTALIGQLSSYIK